VWPGEAIVYARRIRDDYEHSDLTVSYRWNSSHWIWRTNDDVYDVFAKAIRIGLAAQHARRDAETKETNRKETKNEST